MMSSKHRPPRRGNVGNVGNVVKGPFRKKNPVEEEKPSTGVNYKQVIWIGALTALTGTIVGTVATEVYRHFRPKIPIPQPGAQPAQVVQNPGYPQPQLPLGWAPAQPTYAQAAAPAFVPGAVQQVGAFPPQQPAPQLVAQPPAYVNAPALQAGAYATNPMPALPPAQPPAQHVPAVPQPPSSGHGQAEPLTRPELAQWQRRLEGWERELERREPRE